MMHVPQGFENEWHITLSLKAMPPLISECFNISIYLACCDDNNVEIRI